MVATSIDDEITAEHTYCHAHDLLWQKKERNVPGIVGACPRNQEIPSCSRPPVGELGSRDQFNLIAAFHRCHICAYARLG